VCVVSCRVRWGVRFPDMSNAYDLAIRNVAHDIAEVSFFSSRNSFIDIFIYLYIFN
jgi:purine nucleoside phosphorylase